jgi:hypothetical protein
MEIDTNIYKIENPETDGFLKTKTQEDNNYIGYKPTHYIGEQYIISTKSNKSIKTVLIE